MPDTGAFASVVGLSFTDAAAKLQEMNYRLRRVSKDGQSLIVTRDFDTARVNVDVDKLDNIISIKGLF